MDAVNYSVGPKSLSKIELIEYLEEEFYERRKTENGF
jgi:hypothetical protein